MRTLPDSRHQPWESDSDRASESLKVWIGVEFVLCSNMLKNVASCSNMLKEHRGILRRAFSPVFFAFFLSCSSFSLYRSAFSRFSSVPSCLSLSILLSLSYLFLSVYPFRAFISAQLQIQYCAFVVSLLFLSFSVFMFHFCADIPVGKQVLVSLYQSQLWPHSLDWAVRTHDKSITTDKNRNGVSTSPRSSPIKE